MVKFYGLFHGIFHVRFHGMFHDILHGILTAACTSGYPKALQNATKRLPKSSQKWYFWGPGTHLGTLTVPGSPISPKLSAQGIPKGPLWGPNGALKRHNNTKNAQKVLPEIHTRNYHKKSDEPGPPEPQKVCFRYRGASISTNPSYLQKDTNMSPKGP